MKRRDFLKGLVAALALPIIAQPKLGKRIWMPWAPKAMIPVVGTRVNPYLVYGAPKGRIRPISQEALCSLGDPLPEHVIKWLEGAVV